MSADIRTINLVELIYKVQTASVILATMTQSDHSQDFLFQIRNFIE